MTAHLDCLEVRFAAPEEDGTIEGTAVKFDTLDSYRTTFDRRAFAWDGKSLPLLWAHDPASVVGSIRQVAVENDGLKIKGRLNLEVSRAREVRAMLLAGDISGLSIGFRRLKDEARSGGVRHITQAQLLEVSFVAIPSVPGSAVTAIRTHSGIDERARDFLAACRAAAQSMRKI